MRLDDVPRGLNIDRLSMALLLLDDWGAILKFLTNKAADAHFRV